MPRQKWIHCCLTPKGKIILKPAIAPMPECFTNKEPAVGQHLTGPRVWCKDCHVRCKAVHPDESEGTSRTWGRRPECGRRNPQVGCIMRCWQAAPLSQQTPHSISSGQVDEKWGRMLQTPDLGSNTKYFVFYCI